MTDKPEFPEVDVAVALIVRDGKILTKYNPKWGAFTLPMTKRRCWKDPSVPVEKREELWADAAGRAAAECTRKTFSIDFEPLEDVANYRQSDRMGKWQRYHFQIFRIDLHEDPPPMEETEWLSPADILDPRRRPVSPTARDLVRLLGVDETP